MEAFDISNTNGFESVGSMVVYEKGRPRRSDYRKFRLKTVTGPDDYASMYEVLTRRFTHGLEERRQMEEGGLDRELGSFTKFPDLILMDGGKGQVNIALKVLDELHLSIPVCGMVKDDFHRTRGLYYQNEEIPIDKSSEGLIHEYQTTDYPQLYETAQEEFDYAKTTGQPSDVQIQGAGEPVTLNIWSAGFMDYVHVNSVAVDRSEPSPAGTPGQAERAAGKRQRPLQDYKI